MCSTKYDFPVELQDVLTTKGKVIPGTKTVVRLDTDEPISAVSTKYRIITHAEAMGAAKQLMEELGLPSIKTHLSSNGGYFSAVAEYKNITKGLSRVGDEVGLRVVARNSYNTTSKFHLKVGGLVLSCLNGMVSHKDHFQISVCHTGKVEFRMPEKAQVLEAFDQEMETINNFTLQKIEETDPFIWEAQRRGLLTLKGAHFVLDNREKESSVWDILQLFTNHVTHHRDVNEIARLGLQERTSRYFDEMFSQGGYEELMEAEEHRGELQ